MKDIPEPFVAENEVLIEVIAGSVNPVDWKQRMGNHRFILGSPFPIVLGYDVSGLVLKTGSKIGRFKIGDRVCGVLNNKYGGGLAQFAKGKENCFVKVPETIDLATSAALPLAGITALQALRDKGKIAPGKKILIIGAAGGVGHYAQQIASIYKTEVTSVSSLSHKQFLQMLSDHSFIDYKTTNILKLEERFDIIFDTVGSYSFLLCKHLLNPRGVYINTLPRPKIAFHKVAALFTKGKKVRTLLMKNNSDDLDQLINWIAEGKFKICIDKEFFVGQMKNAHEYSEAGHTEGKILIRYNWTDIS